MRLPLSSDPGPDPDPFPDLAEIVDAHTLRFRRLLVTPIDAAWDRVATPSGMESWLATAEIEAVEGSSFTLHFDGHDGVSGEAGSGDTVAGEVVTVVAPALLELNWREDGIESLVRIELDPVGDESRLILTHRLLPDDRKFGFAAGWHQHLARLTAAIDGDVDPGWDDTRQVALVVAYRTEVGPRP